MLERLKHDVAEANRRLEQSGLVTLTWGNVSGIDADRRHVAIKPSGVPYSELTADSIVLVDLQGNVVEGQLRPSSDTPTHLELYRRFGAIGGICHTHSRYATVFAQARCEIPCLGTTHADHFHGPVPLARPLSAGEVETDYELNTGRVIAERFASGGLDPGAVPGVLVAGHGPFTWAGDAQRAVENAIALEAVAAMAWDVLQVNPQPLPLEDYILEKHFRRKHGPSAYYGQAPE